ncbi:MAG: cytochrome c oxidase subunit II transmembrane domain-containing protein, partial [Actinomycetota bacterium]
MLNKRRFAIVSSIGISALLTGCATNAPQDTWQPKGPNSKLIDDLQQPVFAVAGVIGLIVAAAVTYTIIKYRDRGQPIPEQIHGKPALEITLTIIPAMILAGVAVFTFGAIFKLAKTDDTEMIINVTGQQWWWEYDYPVQNEYGITQPIITSGQLVMPVGT